ncbi:hypothetical protein [Brevundimonas sp. SORGH_AS_0993]|uniref:hypothetical protein n=1 Tax=Brevundimonas sp. SORGH_AS_0993 TaxID=3041794 RepID=UPI002782137A|nr:hypothetical protein [Brevundimonas sp. SORGH_AS_0993]MDQ1153440.1 hypothetical protein [Brevundimonas sp. SORGH_AS_0993]
MAGAKTMANTKGVTLGLSRFARISAVEGLRLSDTAEREFCEDDRREVTAEQRRERIIAKYAANG